MRNKPSSSPTALAVALFAAFFATQQSELVRAQTGKSFSVDVPSSRVDFLMEAPIENIHGVATRAIHGDLLVDINDLAATRGRIKVDLDRLEVFQSKLDEDTGQFASETKNEKQNDDMKSWLEISDDVPSDTRERNRWITFEIQEVSILSGGDVASAQGAERKAKARIRGDFSLHGHQSVVMATMLLSFRFEGQELKSIRISSVSPVNVSLEQYDIRPRSAFEKLAAKTLGALGQKVAQSAPVHFSFGLTAAPNAQ